MSIENVKVMNTHTGQTANIRRDWFDNPRIVNRDIIVEVTADTKPYAKATYKPRSAQEFEDQHPEKIIALEEFEEAPWVDEDEEQEDEDA